MRKILVVDDHGIVRDGLIALLGRAGGMQVVGCAGSGEEAVLAARGLRPDVIVMDLVMPALNGFDATRRILAEEPLTHIIVLSGCHTSEHVHRALLAGARGYVTKSSTGAELLPAIAAVVAGSIYVSPGITPLGGAGRASGHMSERERDVLKLLVAGASGAEISRRLSLSPKSVGTYRHRLMVKLAAANRAALIRLAIEYDLLSV